MAGVVLDSSIALSWCLPDEAAPDVDEVQRTVRRRAPWWRRTGRSRSPTPCSWRCADARIDAGFRDAALRNLSALPIALDPQTSNRAWRDTSSLAEAYRLTVYDGAYLELAHRRDLPLATLDAELRAAARAPGVALLGA
jgi:predicted nucleic acid-binding protein